jgi:uncharacterized membrane protein YhaH (DUF805 family)
MCWFVDSYKKMFVGKGRASRKEYWLFSLFSVLFVVSGLFLVLLIGGLIGQRSGDLFSLAWVLLAVSVLIAQITVAIRRLHDIDKNGAFVLLPLIPFVGGIIFLVFMCTKGTDGNNSYGSDPLQGTNLASGTYNSSEPSDEDPEVARLRQRLHEAEKQAANKAELPKLRERKMLAESRVRELTRELEETEALIAQLDNK